MGEEGATLQITVGVSDSVLMRAKDPKHMCGGKCATLLITVGVSDSVLMRAKGPKHMCGGGVCNVTNHCRCV